MKTLFNDFQHILDNKLYFEYIFFVDKMDILFFWDMVLNFPDI
jgi:hypothetical protein